MTLPIKEAIGVSGDLGEQVGELTTQLKAALGVMEESKATDSARWQAADEERVRLATELQAIKEKADAAKREEATAKATAEMQAFLADVRTPSKSRTIGGASYGSAGYEPGSFLRAVHGVAGNDPEAYTSAKAVLEQFGGHEDNWGKATLGDTAAAGGWVVPNAIVDDLIKPASFDNPYPALCTVVNGVTAPAVDIPFRTARPARAVIAAFGATKENVDLTYNGYTATMYTLARIHDAGNQFLRQSAGAAEADIMGELATAFALGERYYIISGSGSSQPYGLSTALAASPAEFTSSFSPGASQAGSAISAIATAAGALGGRGRHGGLTAVVNAATLWTAVVGQGTDTAGFWFAGTAGAPSLPNLNAGTAVTPFGIPVIGDDQLAADDLIVGQFKALKIYHGESYRVESSSVAGTRWDANVTGFRGEMELGLDARAAVFAGAFQFVADIVP